MLLKEEELHITENAPKNIIVSDRATLFNLLIGLVKKGMLTLAQAAEESHMTVAKFEAKTGLKA